MEIISVNIGQECAIENAKPTGKTGIYKQPTGGPVQVTRLGLAGDVIVDTKHHGGPDQALYIYTQPDYAWWSQELGVEVGAGTFGDNLTLSEVESAAVAVGDRFLFGEVILEATAPRIPCETLAARMGDAHFIARFRRAERPGIYCRVIHEGLVQAGMAVDYQPYAGETLTLGEMFREYYHRPPVEEALRRQLKAPIAARARREKEEQLERLKAQG